ncbi:MAG: sulfatase [Planctomycetes bacterium]|nr:sulfatase [Planctomycetota bacterium]
MLTGTPRNAFTPTRRQFLGGTGRTLATAALGSLLNPRLAADTHHTPRAKRVIYLFMAGAPSQLDLWDYKPGMAAHFDKELPESIRMGQRITTMTSGQERFPVAPSMFKFACHGECGRWVSELLPHTAGIVDKLTLVKSVHTEAINHDPAITFIQTGSEQAGRPSLGAWLSYGLGSSSDNLPSFVVLTPRWSARRDAQALFSRLWGSGWLPSEYQGVSLRSSGDPVLFLKNPAGLTPEARQRMLAALERLNRRRFTELADTNINARIAQYELASRMQTSVPELTDIADEPKHVLDLYGPQATIPGTFANHCLLARRLAERDVRFTQIFHRGWDQHGDLPADLRLQCGDVDQPCAALILDLEQRGLLDDTLVIWGGEFGRTIYSQGTLTTTDYGRDHHPRNFCVWMAGAGIKQGHIHGETDEFSYNVVADPVHVHDLNATILHLLGIDHERLTFRYQGRDFRLTDIGGRVVREILA